ncbi:MAG: metalloregulator ArsR/SmtB family transcription factor [Candidatus Dormibacteraeota bacterium]|nr:metalloregulator ArsR/SmtB family transcription factor [Candidatus Dormibacteraeota bacterium]
MESDAGVVATLSRVLAHADCVRLLDALTDLPEATVNDLVTRLGINQPRVSSHLALLRGAGLVRAENRGRQRVYAMRGRSPALALATLRTLAADAVPGVRSPSAPVAADAPIRLARTCYDHLAGVEGVRVLEDLLHRDWVGAAGERDYEVTAAGAEALAAAGVDVAGARRARRAFAIGCADWTERRPHLGGALGAAILDAMLAQERIRLQPGGRAVWVAEAPWPA